MRIDITTSLVPYATKPTKEEFEKNIQYIKRNLTIDEITYYIKNGYVLSANFAEDYDTIIKQYKRSYQYFISTNLMMIDIDDDVECSLSELVDGLKVKPTIAYTTMSHLQEGKGCRYRLLFFFKESIININLFKELYDTIININELSLRDNCGKNPAQAILGSNKNCELIKYDTVYSLSQFQLKNENKNGHSNSIKEKEENNIEIESPIQDEQYISDF